MCWAVPGTGSSCPRKAFNPSSHPHVHAHLLMYQLQGSMYHMDSHHPELGGCAVHSGLLCCAVLCKPSCCAMLCCVQGSLYRCGQVLMFLEHNLGLSRDDIKSRVLLDQGSACPGVLTRDVAGELAPLVQVSGWVVL